MAKDPDDFDFDELNLDDMGGDDDGGFDSPMPKDDRSPVTKLAGSFTEGVKSAVKDPSNQVRFIKKALPPGYQQAVDVAGEVVGGARTLYDSALKEAQPIIKDVKKGVKILLPGVKGVLPTKFAEKLEAWSTEMGSSTPSIDPEENEIAMTLGSIFSAYQEKQQEQQAEGEAKQEVRDLALMKQGEHSIKALGALQTGIGRLVSYQDQVNAQFQRKSLELQYRQYFTTRKLLEANQQHLELSKSSYEILIKNTALPEVVKIHNTEMARHLMKERFLGQVTEPMSQWFRGIGRRIITKGRSDIQSFFRDLGSSINEAVMAGEMMQSSMDDMGMSGTDMALDMAGGALAENLVSKGTDLFAPKVKKFLQKSGMFNAGNFALMRVFQDMPGMVQRWARSDTDQEGFLGQMQDWLKSAVGTHKVDHTIQSSMVDSLDQSALFDLQTRRTITDVIPGWLSKIHLELKMTRTKGKDDEAEHYDWEMGSFVKQSEVSKKLQDKIFSKTDAESDAKMLNEIVKKIDPQNELPKHIRKALARYFNDQKRNGESIALGRFLGPDAHFHLQRYFPDQDEFDKLQEFLIERFGKDPDAEYDTQGYVKGMKNNLWGGLGKEDHFQQRSWAASRAFNEFQQRSDDNRKMQDTLNNAKAYGISHLAAAGAVVWDESSKRWVLNTERVEKDLLDAFDNIAPETVVEEELDSDGKPVRRDAEGNIIQRRLGGRVYRARGGAVGIRRKRFAGGSKGRVTGPGGPEDDRIPASLSNGEFVVRAKAVNVPGVMPLLRYINSLGNNPDDRLFGGDPNRDGSDPSASSDQFVDGLHDLRDALVNQMQTTNETLLELQILVEEIKDKPFYGISLPEGMMPDLSFMEQGAVKATRGIKKLGKWGWGKARSMGAAVKSFGGGMLGRGRSVLGMAWNTTKDLFGKARADFGSIYVKGKEEALIKYKDLKEGKYFDKATKKVITSFKDIKGEVVDAAGEVIISAEDYAKGLYDKNGKRILDWVGKKFSQAKALALKPFQIAKSTMSKIARYVTGMVDMPEDIYVLGEDTPRILAKVWRAGGYFLKTSGKVLSRFSDINDTVVDAEGNTVLTLEDMRKGLVNKQGKPIRGLGDRVGDLFKGALKLPGKAFGLLKKAGGWAAGMVGKGWDALKNVFKAFDAKFGFSLFSMNTHVVDRLDMIYALLDERMPGGAAKASTTDTDGDGDREGSAADQKQEKEAEQKEKDERSWREKMMGFFKGKGGKEDGEKKGGMFDMLGKLPGLLAGATGLLSTALTALGPVGTIIKTAGGLLGKLGGGALSVLGGLGKGAMALGKGAMKLGRFAAPALRMIGGRVGMAALGVITGPVGLAIGAGLAIYSGYQLYKELSKDDHPITAFRMAQYGFDVDDEDEIKKIAELEKECLSVTNVAKGSQATFTKGKTMSDLIKIFGVSEDDQENVEKWVAWFNYRFKPVFLSHMTVLFDLTGKKDLDKVDDNLFSAQKMDYLKRVHFGMDAKSPYAMMANPFPGEDRVEYAPKDVKEAYEDALEAVEDDAKDHDKKVSESTGKKPPPAKPGQESGWWKATKDTMSSIGDTIKGTYEMAVQNVSQLMEGGADKLKQAGRAAGDIASAAASGYQQGGFTGALKAGAGTAYAIAKGDAKKNRELLIAALVKAGVTDPTEQAMFLSQMHTESGGFTRMEENLNYKADRLMQMFDAARKAGATAVQQAVNQGPAGIADLIYGNRMGNNSAGDGYRYRGRGFIQLTGRENYEQMGRAIGVDLLNNPDLASRPDIAAQIAVAYWRKRVPSQAARAGDVKVVTRAINGGYNGLSERQELFKHYMQDITSGKLSLTGQPVLHGNMTLAEFQAASASGSGKPAPGTAKPLPASTGGAPAAPPPATTSTTPAPGKASATRDALAAGAAGTAPAKPGSGTSSGGTDVNDPERARLIAIGRRSYTLKDSGVIMKLAPEFEATIMALFGEYFERTGKKVLVTSAYRDPEKQAQLYANYCSGKGPMAAKPGKSKHETGNAIDINTPDANYMADKGLLKKYKLHRPYLNHPKFPEPWHIEAIGTSASPDCSDTSLNVQPAGAPQNPKAIKAEEKLTGTAPAGKSTTSPLPSATPTQAVNAAPANASAKPAADMMTLASKEQQTITAAQADAAQARNTRTASLNMDDVASIQREQLRIMVNSDATLTTISETLKRMEQKTMSTEPSDTESGTTKPDRSRPGATELRKPPVSVSHI